MFQCCTSLRVLIRRPFSVSNSRTTKCTADHDDDDDDLESLTVCTSLAASILSSYDTIEDDDLKYCFPFSHYLTSATMVMIGLVAREPSLKRRYADLILSASRSLNVYCHRVWVSGKMMRWVSHLTKIVRETFSDMDPSTPGRLQQGLDVPQRASDAGSRADDIQQLTPRSDNHEYLRSRHNDMASSYCRMSVEDYNPMATNPEIQGSKAIGKIDNDAELWLPHDGGGANMQPPPELPSWALSDFNFEAMISDGEAVGSNRFSSELSNIANDVALSRLRAGYSDTDRHVDNSIFEGLGLSTAFDMDVDIDQAMINLGNPTHLGL